MTPLVSELVITIGGVVPLLVLVALYLRRESQLTAAHKADPAE